MSTLKEISEFINEILLLELNTPIRGSDGETIGPANEQAYALACRTQWLKERYEELGEKIEDVGERKFVASINRQTGDLTITVESLGAAEKNHKHKPSDIETNAEARFVSDAEKSTWSDKQNLLISGKNIKTVLGMSLLGGGDIRIVTADITESDDKRFVNNEEVTAWDAKQNALKSGESIVTLHGKNLLGKGNLNLTPVDIGADAKGAGQQAVKDHITQQDPHEQYLNITRADEHYVRQTQGNKPGGFLQLDDNGYIPSSLAKLYEARYSIVSTKEERLGLEKKLSITICLQLDVNRIFYLDADLDPSESNNWKEGRTTDVSDVVSVFGRSGIIEPESGDYNTDQITETANKLFVSPDEKKRWDNKQDLLVSGEGIKTLNKTPILGSGDITLNPEDIGAAEKQHRHLASDIDETDDRLFASPVEKKKWDNKQDTLVSGKSIKTINGISVVGEGNVSITAKNIGAEEAGTGESLLRGHVSEEDPHPQYLNIDKGKKEFVSNSTANKPGGFLQLDTQGLIPSGIASLYEVRYSIVDNEEQRLALKENKNITICLQSDVNLIYYLDGYTDPTISDNWKRGRSTEVSDVISVFGRSGIVSPENGDYNADQITETDKRKFVTPEEKLTWAEKQDKLKSGVSIKTLFGQDILGKGDLKFEDLEGAQEFLFNLLEPGEGVEISIDPDTNKILITNTLEDNGTTGPGTDSGKWHSDRVIRAKAGRDYSYFIGTENMRRDVDLYVLQYINVSPAGIVKVAYDEVLGETNSGPDFEFSTTNQKLLSKPVSEVILEETEGGLYSADPGIDYTGTGFNIISNGEPLHLLPYWSGKDDPYTPFASVMYNNNYGPENAFKEPLSDSAKKSLSGKDYYSSDFKKLSERDVFIGVKLQTPGIVSAYELQLYSGYALGGNMADITGWEFQGTNENIDKGDEDVWTTIDVRSEQTLRVDNPEGWVSYEIDPEKIGFYKNYRIFIKDCANNARNPANNLNKYIGIPRIRLLTPSAKLVLKDTVDNYYTVKETGGLTKVEVNGPEDILLSGFYTSGVVDNDTIPSTKPLTVVSNDQKDITVESYKSAHVITIHNPLVKNIKDWTELEFIKPRTFYNENDGGSIKIAATVDNETYYVFEDGNWVSIGKLGTDSESADLLSDRGMTASLIGSLISKDWVALCNTIPETDTPIIGLAYCTMVSNQSDSKTPRTVAVSLGDVVYRKKVDADIVGVTLTKKNIIFTPTVDGDFRFGYKLTDA